jgi:uncharacterized protein (TIGR02271 family)
MANTTTRVPGTTNATIAGLFKDQSAAEKAIEQLRTAGVPQSQIGVATPRENGETGSFWERLTSKFGKHEYTEEADVLENSLTESGIPQQQARYFNSELGKGGVLVTVHGDSQNSSEAVQILQRNGADVGSAAAEWKGPATAATGGRNIQLLGEILRVHKERVPRGEVRLRKEIVTEQQNIEVPTTREELVIDRVPVQGREAAGVQIGSGEKEIRVPLSEERVNVEKKPVVNEEIHVGKREVQDTKRVSDQVRHEELRTEGNVKEDVERAREKTRKTA